VEVVEPVGETKMRSPACAVKLTNASCPLKSGTTETGVPSVAARSKMLGNTDTDTCASTAL
jgi:hypothetical protein